MKKRIITIMLAVMIALVPAGAMGKTSDADLAKAWKAEHCKSGHIEKVKTTAQGGYKGNAGRWSVRYPKKVKKGKRVTVYMVVKGDDVEAMICLGVVK